MLTSQASFWARRGICTGLQRRMMQAHMHAVLMACCNESESCSHVHMQSTQGYVQDTMWPHIESLVFLHPTFRRKLAAGKRGVMA